MIGDPGLAPKTEAPLMRGVAGGVGVKGSGIFCSAGGLLVSEGGFDNASAALSAMDGASRSMDIVRSVCFMVYIFLVLSFIAK